ncbi:MAG: PDZ domain-containing protein, partial [Acidimicrobiia bacterium]
PVDEAIPFIAYVVGEAGQPFLGVGLASVTPQLAGRFELPVDRGAVVIEVFGGAPGAEAGLRPGDIVITANGTPIRSREALIDEIRDAGVGGALDLVVVRIAEPEALELEIAAVVGER